GRFSRNIELGLIQAHHFFSSPQSNIYDIFIAKYNTDAEFIWAAVFPSPEYDYIYSLSENDLGDIFAFGYFRDTIDLDPSTDTFNLNGSSISSGYMLKLNELESDTDRVISCAPYHWMRNATVYSGVENFHDTIFHRDTFTVNTLVLGPEMNTFI